MSLEKKIEAIEQLKKSKNFPKNELNFQLLDYLAKLEEGRNVKSSVIAIELLGEKEGLNSNSQDAYIRNKLHQLRKSLELYYHTEGKNNTLQLQIPNRYYKLVVTEKKETSYLVSEDAPTSSFWKKASTAYLLLAACLLAILSYWLFTPNVTTVEHKDNFVSFLLGSSKKVDVVVGDTQLYSEYDEHFERTKYVYDKEFYYQDAISISRLVKDTLAHRKIKTRTGFFHASIETMLIASKIQLAYGLQGIHTEIRRASSILTIQRPTVFISQYTACQFYNLSDLFKSERFVYSTYGDKKQISSITHFKTATDSLQDINENLLKRKNQRSIKTGYIIIKKMQTPNDKPLLFLLPENEFSKPFIIDKLDDDDFHKYLIDSFEEGIPDEFEMLIRIEKERRQDSRYEMIYLNDFKE